MSDDDDGYELDLWEVIACRYCDAPAGEPCHTRAGAPARLSHACRVAWWDGTE